jgi:glycosyltransferase involved in cell wall biosynthesis
MHILMAVQDYDSSDPFTGFIVTWAERFAERVDQLSVVSLRVAQSPTRNNISLYSMGKEKVGAFRRLRYLWNWHLTLRKIYRSHPPDAIFTHMTPIYSVLAFPYAWWHGTPIVTWYSHPSITPVTRLSLRLSTLVITAAQEIYQCALGKSVLTGNGVDLRAFQPLRDKNRQTTPIVLTIGRIAPLKDYEPLIEAAARLRELDCSPLFRIIGPVKDYDRDYLEGLKHKVRDLGLENSFEWAGERPPAQVPAELHQAAIFVNMQPTGGFGKAVLEAMATGLPTVVSTPAFNQEMGKWAERLVYRPGDAETLAEKIHGVIRLSHDEHEALSQQMLEIARNHSLDSLVDFLVLQMANLRKAPEGVTC